MTVVQLAVPYTWLRPLWKRVGLPDAELGNVYVVGWLVALIALFSRAPQPSWELGSRALITAVAGYRLLDLVSFYVEVILRQGERKFRSFERSVVLLGLNAAESVVALAIFLRASGVADKTDALYGAFLLLTQMDTPATGTEHIRFVTVLGIALGLLLLIVALSLFVGAIGQQFSSYGAAAPDVSGPVPPVVEKREALEAKPAPPTSPDIGGG
ncbi:MAG: hypothetical protein ACRDNB_12255 [Gaiellaceae bacterium]